MRIFKTKAFDKFAQKNRISDRELLAQEYLKLTTQQILTQIKRGYFIEIFPEVTNE